MKKFFKNLTNFIKAKKGLFVALSCCAVVILGGVGYGIYAFASGGLFATGVANYKDKDNTKPLGSNENPYTIVEVVPNKNMAQVGYFIEGAEPNSTKKIGAISDALTIYKDNFAKGAGATSEVSANKTDYIFNHEKDLLGWTPSSGFSSLNDDESLGQGYSEFGYFVKVNGNGNYNYTSDHFVEVNGNGNFDWVKLGHFVYKGTGNEVYDRQGGGYTTMAASASNVYTNYVATFNGNYEFVADKELTLEDYINFNKFSTSVEINSATTGQKLYYTRTEPQYNSYQASDITNKNVLTHTVFGDDKDYQNGFISQVVTVTPEELNVLGTKEKNLINTCDEMIFHDMTVGLDIAVKLGDSSALPEADKNFNNHDLSWNTVKEIINREAGANPCAIVFDESAVATGDVKTNNRYVHRLYKALNSDGAKYFYNVVGTSSNPSTGKYTPFEKSGDVIGASHFVYNFSDDKRFGEEFSDNKITRIDNNDSAFNITSTDNSMNTAMMLKALYKESQGEGQPKHLNILELEPINSFAYNNTNNNWYATFIKMVPWFIGTGTDFGNDVTVTTQTTYQFDGKIEDVNENYDLIYIGSKQDATNGLNGYNDNGTHDDNGYKTLSKTSNYTGNGLGNLAYTAVGDLITTFGSSDTYRVNTYANNPCRTYGLYFADETIDGNPGNKWYARKTLTRNDILNKFFGEPIGYGNIFKAFSEGWTYTNSSYTQNADGSSSRYIYTTGQGSDAYMVGLRYEGTDITKKKYQELLDFAKKSPIVVDGRLYDASGTKIDESFVDRSSFIYQIADVAVNNSKTGSVENFGKNTCHFMTSKALLNGRCNIEFAEISNLDKDKYGNIASIEGKPTEYVGTYSGNSNVNLGYGEKIAGNTVKTTTVKGVNTGGNSNIQVDYDNNKALCYNFVFSGDEGSEYGVNVYVDSNGNGIYEGSINHVNELRDNGMSTDESTFETERSSKVNIYDITQNGILVNSLVNGHKYYVTRTLPESEVGLLPWKLEIYNKANTSIRTSEVGYTRIATDSANKKKIRILQMNTYPTINVTTDAAQKDMENYMSTNKAVVSNADCSVNLADTRTVVGAKFREYTKNLPDYDVEIYYLRNYDWASTFNSANGAEEWKNWLLGNSNKVVQCRSNVSNKIEATTGGFDMLIIGFRDSATFTNDQRFLYGFEAFRDAGKSIILSHDLTQDATFNITGNYNSVGYVGTHKLSKDTLYYIRDIGGQNRKYYNAADPSTYNNPKYGIAYSNGRQLNLLPNDKFEIFTSIKETWNGNIITWTSGNYMTLYETGGSSKLNKNYYLYGTDPTNMASINMDNSNRAMLFYSNISKDVGNTADKIDRVLDNSYKEASDFRWGTNKMITQTVKLANDGKITKYPYDIPETISVAKTHTQNFALDLEYDDDGDVLVWYNLATANNNDSKIYGAKDGDSRNNYYIYTKGNITYTGLGHSTSKDSLMTDDEIKLFVNTMIASYRSTSTPAYVEVTNQSAVKNGSTSTLYVENRDNGGVAEPINYQICDNTVATHIGKTYNIDIFKSTDGGMTYEPVEIGKVVYKGQTYQMPVNYSEVVSEEEVKYKITLTSSYKDVKGNTITDKDNKFVNVLTMPMFSLR